MKLLNYSEISSAFVWTSENYFGPSHFSLKTPQFFSNTSLFFSNASHFFFIYFSLFFKQNTFLFFSFKHFLFLFQIVLIFSQTLFIFYKILKIFLFKLSQEYRIQATNLMPVYNKKPTKLLWKTVIG